MKEMIFLLLDTAFSVYFMAIIIYILMSWLPGARESTFGQALASICEPYLEIFRRIIPPLGMIDISPIVAIILLRLAKDGLNILLNSML